MPTPDSVGRPIDALLASYAAGSLSRPLHTLVASHLILASENRGYVDALEALKGNELEQGVPVAISSRDAKLAAIFTLPQDSDTAPRNGDDIFPAPLQDYVGRLGKDIPWRTKLPGLKEYVIEASEHGEASLLWIKPGAAMPVHTHEGTEVTLVLSGGFSDAYGDYDRGDVAFADESIDHKPIADPVEGCICFAVTDAPVRLTGPIGRIIDRLLRR
jgi:putative transcriptional regulator